MDKGLIAPLFTEIEMMPHYALISIFVNKIAIWLMILLARVISGGC